MSAYEQESALKGLPSLDVSSAESMRMALELQYPELQPSLVRFLVGFGVARSDAEDITQDTFLKSLRRRSSTRIDNLFHWLCTCAKNLAITRFHRSRRELLVARECWSRWEATIASPACSALTRLEDKETFEQLARAFRGLNPRERQCLILRSQGLTFGDISEALGISMKAGVYATGAALRKLHRELDASEL